MKKKLFSLILLTIVSGAWLAAQDKTLLYEITGNGLTASSYVFGTIHIMCPDDLNFSPELKSAVTASEKIVFELDFDDPDLGSELQSGLTLGQDLTWKSYLTDAEFGAIDSFTRESIGQPTEIFSSMRPFFLMSMVYAQFLECTPVSMETELMNLGGSGKEVLGLETVQEQLTAINSLSVEAQTEMLVESIKNYEMAKNSLLDMVQMYKAGDIDGLYEYTQTEFSQFENFDQIMLADRNRNWIGPMETLMKEGPVFFGVGAAHLSGGEGVVQLLRNKGYSVRPVLQTVSKPLVVKTDLNPMEQVLPGKWQIHEKHIQEMTDMTIENASKANPQIADQLKSQRAVIENMIINTVKEYKPDGTYTLVIPNGGGVRKGTWGIVDNELQEKDEAGEETVRAILKLTGEVLIIQKEGESPKEYTRKL